MHNMSLKWPVFISYVISVMDECFFAESLKRNAFYHLFLQVFIKYLVFDFHKSLFIFPFFTL